MHQICLGLLWEEKWDPVWEAVIRERGWCLLEEIDHGRPDIYINSTVTRQFCLLHYDIVKERTHKKCLSGWKQFPWEKRLEICMEKSLSMSLHCRLKFGYWYSTKITAHGVDGSIHFIFYVMLLPLEIQVHFSLNVSILLSREKPSRISISIAC